MRTEQEQIDKMARVVCGCSYKDLCHLINYDPCADVTSEHCCYKAEAEALIKAGYGDVLEYKAEIKRLKNANNELVDNLVFYKDKSYELEKNVDKLKTDIQQEVKQAQIDVLNRLYKKVVDFYDRPYSGDRFYCGEIVIKIDELIKEVQNAEDKG